MASSLLLRLGLALLLLGVCSAQLEPTRMKVGQQRWRTECRFDRLQAMKPTRTVEAEAGLSEYWDVQGPSEVEEQLQCVGMAASRHTIQTRGLLLPSFLNAPMVFYVVQGRGIHGAVFPGCPETYETGSQAGEPSQEKHQKVREIRQGDMIAAPAGVTQWVYNNGDSPLILVSFIDVGNQANQLDLNARRFHLAGNPKREQQTEQEVRFQSETSRRLRKEGGGERKISPGGNMFSGIATGMLARSFNIDDDLARRLQSQDDRRERIVRVRGEELRVLSPVDTFASGHDDAESHRGYLANGVEETFCTMKMRHNIDRPSQADIFNPRGGRLTTANGLNLPILRNIQLTAERGVLYKNAMMAPHFNPNAHSLVYCTRGSGRVQIVDDFGRNVFDGELREGQMLAVPQNFVVVKKASARGLEWIAVKTNDNAMRAPLAGRISAIRAMPDDVLANAFRISRDQARTLKNNRDEVTIFSPSIQGSWE